MALAALDDRQLPTTTRPALAPSARRVLHIVLSLDPGGTERLVVALAERLGAATTAICCLDTVGTWGEQLRRSGFAVTALNRQRGFRPALGYRIGRLAREHRADVIHCHHYSPFVYAALSRLFYRMPRLIFTEHGRLADVPPSRKRRLANSVLARVPDAVFTVSEDLKQHLVREGFRARDVRVLHNGIDAGPMAGAAQRATARSLLGARDDTCLVVTVARLDPVKDLTTMVEAFARVHAVRPHARLAIIGDGPERGVLEGLITSHNLSRSVMLLGHRNDARQLLAGADIYVNSSTFEGISLTILEAMAASLPIVATRVGGNPEIIEGAGVLVPARDAEALAKEVLALIDAAVRRTKLGAIARSRVQRDFSLDHMVQQYLTVYEAS
jgi:glycosyltransferase involved in cell wall biosynthesis